MITVTKIKYIYVKPPKQVLEINRIPFPPIPQTQKDVAVYLIDLWDWARKCENKLLFIKEFVKDANRTRK